MSYDFDFVVSIVYDVAIDVAKCALLGKVVQGSPCLEMRTQPNDNWNNIMKLNDCRWSSKQVIGPANLLGYGHYEHAWTHSRNRKHQEEYLHVRITI